MAILDTLGSFAGQSRTSRWANRALIVGLLLFALSVPHSVAAAHISLSLSLIAWFVRDLAAGRLQFRRTPLDLPILCFSVLSIVSAVFSVEPQLSLRKLLSLLLFGAFYFFSSNLSEGGSRCIATVLIVSGLVGVAFSLGEKAVGRGMTVTSIEAEGPLASSGLQPGDVIWMVSRHRVSSLDEAAQIIRSHRVSERVEIEAIHQGDPFPLVVEVTEDLLARSNPLGVTVGGRSRRFRVSGFTRHFLTYAEQMQIFGLVCFGGLLVAARSRRSLRLWLLLFALFSSALVLTASRAVIASYLLAMMITAAFVGGRRAALWTMAAGVLMGVCALGVLSSSRTLDATRLIDYSASRRVAYMRAGLRMIPRHPLLGVGIDSHKLHWREWGFPGDYVTHTHSTPIQIAMDRGLPALACLCWLLGVMLLMMWRGYRREVEGDNYLKAILYLGTFGALIGFAASSLVNYNFGDSEVLMLIVGFVGLAEGTRDKGHKGHQGHQGQNGCPWCP